MLLDEQFECDKVSYFQATSVYFLVFFKKKKQQIP